MATYRASKSDSNEHSQHKQRHFQHMTSDDNKVVIVTNSVELSTTREATICAATR
jgi:hypothetical protein